MTEQEWRESDDPVIVMCGLKGRISDRKYRLFEIACAAGLSSCWPDDKCRKFLDSQRIELDGEAHRSDGEIDEMADWIDELARSKWNHAAAVFTARHSVDSEISAAIKSYAAVGHLQTLCGSMEWWHWINEMSQLERPETLEQAYESFSLTYYKSRLPLLRCIVGNPFRHVTIDPSWLTWNDRTVPKLARKIYDEERFDLMPILGDALEDAHCQRADILDHCRERTEHVRGCWVVDSILGKT